jgi:hypothetical protein
MFKNIGIDGVDFDRIQAVKKETGASIKFIVKLALDCYLGVKKEVKNVSKNRKS